MEYNCFLENVKNEVQSLLGQEYNVKIDRVLKNNSKHLDSMHIYAPKDNVVPAIGLNDMYPLYLEGTTIEQIAHKVIDIYNNNKIQKERLNLIVSSITNYDMVKDNIVVRMINKDMNEGIMQECPYIEYLDFILTFHFLIKINDYGDGSVRITNELLGRWGINLSQLSEDAMNNTLRLLPPKVDTMEHLLQGFFDIPNLADVQSAMGIENAPLMYVVTNEKGLYGATVLLYNGLLENMAKELESDLVIIPSSVHEVILLTGYSEYDLDMFLHMVEEVNDTQVEITDLLSYNVYVYVRDEKRIKIYPADFMN